MMHTSDSIEDVMQHRYEETAGEYRLRTWCGGIETHQGGPVAHRATWLSVIIDVARMGDHAKVIPAPPPELIVWFTTNPDDTLANFIDFTNGTTHELR